MMDALISYSQSHQQLMNASSKTTPQNSISTDLASSVMSFQPQAACFSTSEKQTDHFNSYMLANSQSYSSGQLTPLQGHSTDDQNKINDFFKLISAQHSNLPLSSSSPLVSSGFGASSPAISHSMSMFREQTEQFNEDPNFYNVAAAYNAVSASLVGRLASNSC